MNNNLIVVKQLPVIEERLHEIKAKVEERVSGALSLVVTEDTYKDVKKVRADLSKEFKEFEEQRKAIKKAISEPYEQFEKVYSECVSSLYKSADEQMKSRISSIEDTLKAEKTAEVAAYFEEYAQSLNIDFVSFERTGIKVDMTISKKKLKEQAKEFLDKVQEELKMINSQDYATEIFVEYKKSLNAVSALNIVTERHREIEKEKTQSPDTKAPSETIQENIPQKPLEAPKEAEDEKIYPLKFTVYGTKAQLKELKEFIIRSGLRYE